MNVVSSGRHKRPSKLLDALRHRAQERGTGHLGFGAVTTQTKQRPAVVVSLTKVDKATIAALAQSGVDGIEVAIATEADLVELRSASSVSPIPLGIVLDAAGWLPSNADELSNVDWVRLSLRASAAILAWEKPARFITIPEDMDLRRLPALNVLEVDAVLAEGPWVRTGDLRIEDVLRLAALSDICKMPVFLGVGPGLNADLISVAKQCGVSSLLYLMEADTTVATVAADMQALEAKPGVD